MFFTGKIRTFVPPNEDLFDMKYLRFLIVALLAFCCAACQKYRYETVEGDPLATRIYTLDNGLKVLSLIHISEPTRRP